MKTKFYTFVALLATAYVFIIPSVGHTSTVSDSVTMGSGYSNEIYYSMSAGIQGSAIRSTWDIAFRTDRMSADIITNDGSGVELYTYPLADTSGWASVDITLIGTWKKMYNSTTDWETGAFCINQKGHPDYGWCKYNAVTHDLWGDSLFIIKLRDGSLRKLWIKEKFSSLNIYEFRFANIDGTGDKTITLDCTPYTSKNFVGYDITLNKVVDYEPVAATKWDILFTKYMGINQGQPYPVIGVLSNYKVKVKKFVHVPTDTILAAMPAMDITRSPIGYDWKTFTGTGYKVTDSLVYFVQDLSGMIHRLVFTKFAGTSTGRIVFNNTMNSFTGINETSKSGFNAAVYPNPVSDVMNLVINPGKSNLVLVTLMDITGHIVLSQRFDMQSEELSTLQVPVTGLPSGMYMVKIQSGGNVIARKVIVNN